jgi:hypothetical protein
MYEPNYLNLEECCELCSTPGIVNATFATHEKAILSYFDFEIHIETPATLTWKWLRETSISTLHKDAVVKKCEDLLRLCGQCVLFSCFEPDVVANAIIHFVMKGGQLTETDLIERKLQSCFQIMLTLK